jgi:hypothetical protein
MVDNVKVALALAKMGISVVPLRVDGSKLPKIKWGDFQDRIMTPREIAYHFKECGGIAAVTGKISRLYCLDFDLKYQLAYQDFWHDFMKEVPKEMRKRFLVNQTKNNGKHIWLRTDFEDKSRKLTRRASLIPELMAKYEKILIENDNPAQVSEQLLRHPYEVVIESRSKGSYAVVFHPDYDRFYGDTFNEFSVKEVEFLNNIAFSLDYEFRQKEEFVGNPEEFGNLQKFNDDATPALILSLLEATGQYKYVNTLYDGTIEIVRVGSDSKSSGKIFGDNAVLHLHSSNAPIFPVHERTSFSPFDVFRYTKNLTVQQAIKALSKV